MARSKVDQSRLRNGYRWVSGLARSSQKALSMGDRPSETVRRTLTACFVSGLSGISDGQLLERFGAQSDSDGQVAFEAIVRRHGPMVLGVCLRVWATTTPPRTRFRLRSWYWPSSRPRSASRIRLGPWLHGVARADSRVGRSPWGDAVRASRCPRQGLVDPVIMTPRSADVGSVLDEELGRLPEKYRLPVVLCYLEGQTQEEAARTLGWTKGTVSGRLARAKDLLRHRLTRRGLAPGRGCSRPV